MHINWQLRELNVKIVYYGPAMSGKTTNLEQIHARMDPAHRSELLSLKTHEDRTLFFDFLQLDLGKVNGLTPKIQLYTVPGQTYYEASRRLVLRGTDGVVFVADSAPERLHANRSAWKDLYNHLASFHIPVHQTPFVLQCNKQDLPGAVAPEVLKQDLDAGEMAMVPAAAVRGDGVFDTLKAITHGVIVNIQKQLA